MSSGPEASISNSEKIAILLKEYDTLRAEAVVRVGGVNQSVSIGVAAYALIVSAVLSESTPKAQGWCSWWAAPQSAINWWLIGLLFVPLPVVLIWFAWAGARDSKILSIRVQQIENQINTLAGEKLLCWEGRLGIVASGHVTRKIPPDHNRFYSSTQD